MLMTPLQVEVGGHVFKDTWMRPNNYDGDTFRFAFPPVCLSTGIYEITGLVHTDGALRVTSLEEQIPRI